MKLFKTLVFIIYVSSEIQMHGFLKKCFHILNVTSKKFNLNSYCSKKHKFMVTSKSGGFSNNA